MDDYERKLKMSEARGGVRGDLYKGSPMANQEPEELRNEVEEIVVGLKGLDGGDRDMVVKLIRLLASLRSSPRSG